MYIFIYIYNLTMHDDAANSWSNLTLKNAFTEYFFFYSYIFGGVTFRGTYALKRSEIMTRNLKMGPRMSLLI